ncbi:MAG: hypothetical protein QGI60_05825 [archaeon]|nr:hypothetical protein [archaeon]
MGKGFIVAGAEHSGTRMLTKFFCDCGCAGSPQHKQGFDRGNPRFDHKLVVWRRSIPHSKEKTPNLSTMYALFKKIGYDTKIVGITRNKFPNARSQVKMRKAQTEEQAGKRIDAANNLLQRAKARHKNDYISVSYTDFVKSRDYRKDLAERCGLEYSEKQDYSNADEKYYTIEN